MVSDFAGSHQEEMDFLECSALNLLQLMVVHLCLSAVNDRKEDDQLAFFFRKQVESDSTE